MESLLPGGGSSVRPGVSGPELAAVAAADEARQARLARTLRQEIIQPLTALHMDVAWMRQHLGDPEGLDARLAASMQALQLVLGRMSRLGSELGAFVLEDLGLPAALELLADGYAEDTGVACALELTDAAQLDPHRAIGLYRITQEWLEHLPVDARAVRLRLGIDGPEIVLALEATISARPGDLEPFMPPALPARVHAVGGVLGSSRFADGHARIEVRVAMKQDASD